ncbi:MAG: hypothetical protein HY270_09375 [Deltaproteobacteria bacterium]|nr:hypothetical protein [Deltaproteobacteria bacterium]
MVIAAVLATVLGVGMALAEAATPVTEQQTGQEQTPAKAYEGYVIAPGHEELLAQILGQGATLPSTCVFDGGQVEKTALKGTYKCPDGPVVFHLAHPDSAPVGATVTKRFAISLVSGSPPAGLAEAIAANVRAKELQFEWSVPPTPVIPLQPGETGSVAWLALFSGLTAVVLGWLLVRRRRTA